MEKKIKCHICGKEFEQGNRPDGLPNGVGFMQKNGTVINICAECLINIGEKKGGKVGGLY